MERPNFIPILTKKSDYCERSSSKPIKSFVPHQALNLAELIRRFESGQRLNVHCNFAPGSNLMNCTDEEAFSLIKADDMDQGFAPNDVHDIVDVEREYNSHLAHKADFNKRQQEKKQKAKEDKAKKEEESAKEEATQGATTAAPSKN